MFFFKYFINCTSEFDIAERKTKIPSFSFFHSPFFFYYLSTAISQSLVMYPTVALTRGRRVGGNLSRLRRFSLGTQTENPRKKGVLRNFENSINLFYIPNVNKL